MGTVLSIRCCALPWHSTRWGVNRARPHLPYCSSLSSVHTVITQVERVLWSDYVHSLNKYFLSTYHVPGIILGAGDTRVKRQTCPLQTVYVHSIAGERIIRKIDTQIHNFKLWQCTMKEKERRCWERITEETILMGMKGDVREGPLR